MLTPAFRVIGEDQQVAPFSWVPDGWRSFNHQLSRDAIGLPNETTIEKRLAELDELPLSDPRLYWLSLARLAELALKQAGDYADNCEFQAAGDLLVNPRQIDVYQRGWPAPVTKERHLALSDQFASAIGSENPVAWLCRETLTHIRQEALLPYLERRMTASGLLSSEYLASFSTRLRQVASTIGFLCAWQLWDSTDLHHRLATASPADRTLITDHLCCFDLGLFDDLGQTVETFSMNPGARSRFLKAPAPDDGLTYADQ